MVMQQASFAPGQSVGFWHCAEMPPSGHDDLHAGVPPTMQHEVPPVQVPPPQKPGIVAMSAIGTPPPPPPLPPPPGCAMSAPLLEGVLEPHAATVNERNA